MSDLTTLEHLDGEPLTEARIRGILAQIDLDVANLVREGKLSAAKHAAGGPAGVMVDRAANLAALLSARKHYEELLASLPAWETSQAAGDPS